MVRSRLSRRRFLRLIASGTLARFRLWPGVPCTPLDSLSGGAAHGRSGLNRFGFLGSSHALGALPVLSPTWLLLSVWWSRVSDGHWHEGRPR